MHLVLAADIFLDQFLLDPDRRSGQLLLGSFSVQQGVKRAQKPGRERGGRAEAGTGGQIGKDMDIKVPVNPQILQRFTDARMNDLLDAFDQFRPGIANSDLVFKKFAQTVNADIDILIYGGAKDRAALSLKEFAVIRPAAKKTKPDRRPGDD